MWKILGTNTAYSLYSGNLARTMSLYGEVGFPWKVPQVNVNGNLAQSLGNVYFGLTEHYLGFKVRRRSFLNRNLVTSYQVTLEESRFQLFKWSDMFPHIRKPLNLKGRPHAFDNADFGMGLGKRMLTLIFTYFWGAWFWGWSIYYCIMSLTPIKNTAFQALQKRRFKS